MTAEVLEIDPLDATAALADRDVGVLAGLGQRIDDPLDVAWEYLDSRQQALARATLGILVRQ